MSNKSCGGCNQLLPLGEFHKNAKSKDGHSGRCKKCVKAYGASHYAANRERKLALSNAWRRNNPDRFMTAYLKRNYNITLADFNQIFEAQGKCCAICKATDAPKWAVDHCHSSGTVRGILCNACNLGLGQFSDSPERLASAQTYLLNHT